MVANSLGVKFRLQFIETRLDKCVANFESVSGDFECFESLGEFACKGLESFCALIVIDCSGPDPTDAQWSFAPASSDRAVGTFDFNASPGANDLGQHLIAEFQGYAHFHGKEIEAGVYDTHGVGSIVHKLSYVADLDRSSLRAPVSALTLQLRG